MKQVPALGRHGEGRAMRSTRAIPAAVALAACLMLALPAWAGSAGGRLGVGVVVRPSHPAPRALVALPLPAGAQPMTRTPFGGSYRYAGTLEDAAAFYHAAMQQQGYRLALQQRSRDMARLRWEREGDCVELELQQALGRLPALRIVVTASASDAG